MSNRAVEALAKTYQILIHHLTVSILYTEYLSTFRQQNHLSAELTFFEEILFGFALIIDC